MGTYDGIGSVRLVSPRRSYDGAIRVYLETPGRDRLLLAAWARRVLNPRVDRTESFNYNDLVSVHGDKVNPWRKHDGQTVVVEFDSNAPIHGHTCGARAGSPTCIRRYPLVLKSKAYGFSAEVDAIQVAHEAAEREIGGHYGTPMFKLESEGLGVFGQVVFHWIDSIGGQSRVSGKRYYFGWNPKGGDGKSHLTDWGVVPHTTGKTERNFLTEFCPGYFYHMRREREWDGFIRFMSLGVWSYKPRSINPFIMQDVPIRTWSVVSKRELVHGAEIEVFDEEPVSPKNCWFDEENRRHLEFNFLDTPYYDAPQTLWVSVPR